MTDLLIQPINPGLPWLEMAASAPLAWGGYRLWKHLRNTKEPKEGRSKGVFKKILRVLLFSTLGLILFGLVVITAMGGFGIPAAAFFLSSLAVLMVLFAFVIVTALVLLLLTELKVWEVMNNGKSFMAIFLIALALVALVGGALFAFGAFANILSFSMVLGLKIPFFLSFKVFSQMIGVFCTGTVLLIGVETATRK